MSAYVLLLVLTTGVVPLAVYEGTDAMVRCVADGQRITLRHRSEVQAARGLLDLNQTLPGFMRAHCEAVSR